MTGNGGQDDGTPAGTAGFGVFGWDGAPAVKGGLGAADAAIAGLFTQAVGAARPRLASRAEGDFPTGEGAGADEDDDPGAEPWDPEGGAGGVDLEDPDDDVTRPPVQFLGHQRGIFYFLSPSGQVRELADAKLNASGIRGLFEQRIGWLWKRFPRFNKDGDAVVGWGAAQAQEWLIVEAARRGLFDPERNLRGDGVWRDDEGGGLVVHCGDVVLIGGKACPPGRYGKWVYPTRHAQPHPSDDPMNAAEGAALLELLRSWSWSRPDIDPYLLLGWVGCAVLNAALDWRPHVWLGGDKSTGKSWLQELLKLLLGDALKSFADTSAAGIRDALQRSSRPVALDEMEAEEANEKLDAIVKLARIASTRGGGEGVRGSPDGTARYFSIEACFLFSSILIPPLAPQDIQRTTPLDLRPLETDPVRSAAIRQRIDAARALGPRLRRRVLDGWARWPATLLAFESALAAAGHSSRAANQYGALLAMADILMSDGLPDTDSIDALVCHLDPKALRERSDDSADHENCLRWLMTASVDAWSSGERRVVGEEVRHAIEEMHLALDARESQRRLRLVGLAVVDAEGRRWLALSNKHQGVERIFHGSHWGAKAGRTGAWRQSLGRVEGVRASPAGIKFAGQLSRALLIPVEALGLDPGDVHQPGPAPRATEDGL